VLEIENSEFGYNGANDGLSHNLYVGSIARLSVTGSYFHHAYRGHLLKSRAATNYVAYNRYAGNSQGSESEAINFRSNEVREVIVETRGDAQNVLDELFRHIDRYNAVSVAYYYELVGITGKFTDHQWGWTNLNASGVSHVREGYRIELPKPISIK
jgi:hypothetical protein